MISGFLGRPLAAGMVGSDSLGVEVTDRGYTFYWNARPYCGGAAIFWRSGIAAFSGQ
jgi:hypothetical protein